MKHNLKVEPLDTGIADYLRRLELTPQTISVETGASRLFQDLLRCWPDLPGYDDEKLRVCYHIAVTAHVLAAKLLARAVQMRIAISRGASTPLPRLSRMATLMGLDTRQLVVWTSFVDGKHSLPDQAKIDEGIIILCQPLHYRYHTLREDRGTRPRHGTGNLPNRLNRNVDAKLSVEDQYLNYIHARRQAKTVNENVPQRDQSRSQFEPDIDALPMLLVPRPITLAQTEPKPVMVKSGQVIEQQERVIPALIPARKPTRKPRTEPELTTAPPQLKKVKPVVYAKIPVTTVDLTPHDVAKDHMPVTTNIALLPPEAPPLLPTTVEHNVILPPAPQFDAGIEYREADRPMPEPLSQDVPLSTPSRMEMRPVLQPSKDYSISPQIDTDSPMLGPIYPLSDLPVNQGSRLQYAQRLEGEPKIFVRRQEPEQRRELDQRHKTELNNRPEPEQRLKQPKAKQNQENKPEPAEPLRREPEVEQGTRLRQTQRKPEPKKVQARKSPQQEKSPTPSRRSSTIQNKPQAKPKVVEDLQEPMAQRYRIHKLEIDSSLAHKLEVIPGRMGNEPKPTAIQKPDLKPEAKMAPPQVKVVQKLKAKIRPRRTLDLMSGPAFYKK